MKFDVVIAGGGFAGAYCARTLGKALGAEGVRRVALIAERNVFIFQPMLPEVAGSSLSPADVVNPLRLFCRNVNVLQGNIQAVDWSKKTLVLDGGRFTRNHTIGFEHLVLTLGSVTDLSKVPGLADYGWPMKTVADALRLRAALINRLEEANLVEDATIRGRLLTFVVVGGGYTGVETAGQMLDFLHESKRFYANLHSAKLRVVLVHSGEHLLQEIGQKLGDYAQHLLERRGMEVRLNARLTEVTAQKAILQDGTFIETNTIISSIGNAPSPVVLNLCQELKIATNHGRIAVEPTMQVPNQADLWAAGDCAVVPWQDKDGTTKSSPPTAQFALRQGRQLGRNLARVLRGKSPQPFRYKQLGQLATVGKRAAVAEIMGMHFSGFIAWWMWRTIYLAKLPGMLRRLRVMIDWTFELFFPRDISVVLPPPEDLLRSIHLEEGEALFERGDKPRGFFFVRSGSIRIQKNTGAYEDFLAGSVLDQELIGGEGWTCSAVANESSDVVVFRGRALELLKKYLRLVPIEHPIPAAEDVVGLGEKNPASKH
ncbi:MAG: FAD-dependent oxidoreductase [Nibricoccus sp.]